MNIHKGDTVRVVTGFHFGSVGEAIQVFGGYVTIMRPDHMTVQVKAENCEVVHVNQ